MAKIKNMGQSTVRFNEGVIIRGKADNEDHSLIVSGSAVINSITGSLHGSSLMTQEDRYGFPVVGGIFEIDQGVFQNPSTSYNPIYFPSDDSFVEKVAPNSSNYFIAPFDGELIKIQIRSTTDFSTKFLTASLHLASNSSNAYNSSPASSVVINGLKSNETHTFDFMSVSGNSFSEGQIFGFSLGLSGGYAGNETIHFTTTIRYNPYS